MLYTAIAAVAFAATVAAAPSAETKKRASGSDQNISIYRFGDPAGCHDVLRVSGACGISTYFKNVDQAASFVAIPSKLFDKFTPNDPKSPTTKAAPQTNTLCGKTITITHNGVTKTAIVADRNFSNDNSIDTCMDIWSAFGGKDGDGTVIHGATWSVDGV
ncbi:hypothetical protein CCM_01600 [Cordyceps militaris CM01]|uniref:Uncharacterized protein n=1 Tax=Cordyceps militaris (strain CM01) TaxID=983644 RepID=G3J5Y9_CORMM|nr:uncharacterized protein CCM_01600 [Cordyceps militaris CM01]EGX96941.1 hypothetical protein CCM_01600 [Cordyceps militaris CM01]